ncbi:MAG: hypothetical protein ACREM2_08035, partial [Vulcanimicrobiaceae bacterium]
ASPLAALAPFGGDGVDLSGLLQGGGLQGLLPVAGGGSADPSSALGASSLGADSDDALGSLLA